jgi:hypothetical protein
MENKKESKKIVIDGPYTKLIKEAKPYYVYASVSEEGKTEAKYIPISDIPDIKKMDGDIQHMISHLSRLETMMIGYANKLALEHNNHLASVLAAFMSELTVLIPGKSYKALKLNKDKYIIGSLDILSTDLILPTEKAQNITFDGYTKIVNGEPVYDQEKFDKENLL